MAKAEQKDVKSKKCRLRRNVHFYIFEFIDVWQTNDMCSLNKVQKKFVENFMSI